MRRAKVVVLAPTLAVGEDYVRGRIDSEPDLYVVTPRSFSRLSGLLVREIRVLPGAPAEPNFTRLFATVTINMAKAKKVGLA